MVRLRILTARNPSLSAADAVASPCFSEAIKEASASDVWATESVSLAAATAAAAAASYLSGGAAEFRS